MRGSLRRALFLVGLLLAWEAASKLGLWRPWVFPSPSAIGQSLWAGVVDGTIPRGIAVSMRRLVVGYLVSLVGGVALGLLLARSRALRESIGTVVTGLQALPSICWLPLALLWFGLNETAILFVVVAGSLLAIAVATEAGVSNVPPLYVRAARTMGARGATLYLRVILPAALPQILSGMRLGWTFAWRSLMAGELLFVSGGLGQLLATGRELGDMARVMAVMVAIVALGLVTEVLIFRRLDARVREVWGTDRS
ncbi:MAG TPA: ABC transporter permease [Polyangia bacterium]|nr:ABC transporter permease [Polyangia bacterium]